VSISKIIGLMSCGLLLWLGLCHTAESVKSAQASHPPSSADPVGRKAGQVGVNAAREKLKVGHRIEGEVLRVEGNDYFVMGKDWQEIRLYSDPTTRKFGNISQGDRIVATVNNQNHMRSIRLTDMVDMSDRRNEQTDRTMDFTIETLRTGAMGQ
jgi:hypothetical protein